MLHRKILFTALLALHCLLLPALNNQRIRFRHYTVSEGLTSNTVRAIIQDHHGFVWFGTDDGLCRFDGITIRRYAPQNHLRGMAVTHLLDGEREMLVGSFDGLYIFNRETESFTLLDAKTKKGIGIRSAVTSVVRDANGYIWVSTREQGVFRYAPESRELRQYAVGSNAYVATLIVDRNNQVWAASGAGSVGLWSLNKAKNVFMPYNRSLADGCGLYGSALYEDGDGTLWLGSWTDGLVKVRTSGTSIGDNGSYLPAVEPGFTANHIHHVSGFAPHQLLVGSDDGLVIYDTEQHCVVRRLEDNTGLFSTSNRFVYTAIRDHEGGLWAGSFYGGVTYVSTGAKGFAAYQPDERGNSVSGNIINRFCEDERGCIWIASDDGGLSCLNPQTDTFRHYDSSNSGLSYDNVHALCVEGSNLWVGTYTGGINMMNIDSGRWQYYSVNDGASNCYSLFRDSRGNLWAGTMESICQLDRKADRFVVARRTEALVNDIDEDAYGRLWFSTNGGGLLTYDLNTRKWHQYTKQNTRGGLPDNQVNCVHLSADGILWVGTDNGLCRYDSGNGRFVAVPITDNADGTHQKVSECISGIIDDEHGLWLTTHNGLIRYVDGKCQNVFTATDGLVGNQFMTNAALKASDGRIYVGTTSGFSAFYPHLVHTNSIAPQVFITGLEVFNSSIPFTNADVVEREEGEMTFNLSYRDAEFTVLFAALSYVNPEKNQYAYRLDGFDKDWQYVGAQSRATYTNLSPGTYIFRVKATNNDGLWSSQESTVRIVIHPPFYLSWPAKALYAVLMLVFIVMGMRRYRRRMEHSHQQEIERIKADKEEEMRNAKLQFFTIIAHEIRTPVSLIIAPLEKIMAQINGTTTGQQATLASVANDMNMIDRNAHRLLELVNQLLDFRKVEQQKLVMHFGVQNLRQLITSVAERFRPSISQHAEFIVDLPDEHLTAILDNEAITKVVSNLLTNANKYTRDIIRLSCQVSPDDEHVHIIVSDNGVGIRQEDRERIFTPFFQAAGNRPGTGIGLSIVKNIVDLHHGRIQLQSVEGQGSTFTVILPVKQDMMATTATAASDRVSDDSIRQGVKSDSPAAVPGEGTESQSMSSVLLVEDNEDMLAFLMDNFKKKYILLTARDGIEALDVLKNNNVQLIVSDWMMPRMDGAELCRCVRRNQQTSHIPFVLLTAKTDDKAKTEGMQCGADVYIEKPFSMRYLDACLKNLIDMRHLLRQKFSREPLVPIQTIASNPTDDAFLQKMTKIIEDNFSNADLSVDFLAEQLAISRSGLYGKIKLMAGTTPNELIQTIRLKRAAVLLREKKHRVSEVCYMVGFSSPSYFSKCFFKQFGIKPTDFAEAKE